jgi:hypothetical protein
MIEYLVVDAVSRKVVAEGIWSKKEAIDRATTLKEKSKAKEKPEFAVIQKTEVFSTAHVKAEFVF